MKNIKDNFPCKCGHRRELHRGHCDMPKNQHCWAFECPCNGFNADNLIYLEQQYDNNRSS